MGSGSKGKLTKAGLRTPRSRGPEVEAALLSAKLRAYRENSDAVISLNSEALVLDETAYREAADSIALDQESPLEELYLDVNAAYKSNLYLID